MTEPSNPVTEAELHAYADGVLDRARRREVAAYLAAHPEEAARVEAYRGQNAALRALFDPVLDEPVPAALEPPAKSSGLVRGWLAAVAAAVVLFVVGGVSGWFLHGGIGARSPDGFALARRAAVAHAVYAPEVRHPVEVAAAEEAHLVKWLSKRLGAPLRAPSLTAEGYALVGGRLLPGPDGPAAQFMYEDAQGERMTLYVSTGPRGSRETAFSYAEENGTAVFYWIEGPFGYALSGRMEKDRLLRVARAVYAQFEP